MKKFNNILSLLHKLFASLAIILIATNIGKAQNYTEYELKGGYIFNFPKFVHWEDAAQSQKHIFVIGLYGEDPIGIILDQIAELKNKSGKYWMINHYSTPEEIDDCKILFISGISNQEFIELMKQVKGKNILTVGDNIEGFCEHGGIINFLSQKSDKPFEINNQAAIKSKIKISPKLLRLAKLSNF